MEDHTEEDQSQDQGVLQGRERRNTEVDQEVLKEDQGQEREIEKGEGQDQKNDVGLKKGEDQDQKKGEDQDQKIAEDLGPERETEDDLDHVIEIRERDQDPGHQTAERMMMTVLSTRKGL